MIANWIGGENHKTFITPRKIDIFPELAIPHDREFQVYK